MKREVPYPCSGDSYLFEQKKPEEKSVAKITFEFDYYDDREEINLLRNAGKYMCALDEIYNMVRSELKHGDEELTDNVEQLLERIKEEAAIVNQLD